MREESILTIGKLAALSGVTAQTIRYYEREGVIPAPPRAGSGAYRRYSAADAERLRFVRRARDLGFTVEDVRSLVALAENDPAKPCGDANQIARSHLAQIEEKLVQLTTLRAQLHRLIDGCDGETPVRNCTLLSALNGERAT